MVNRDEKSDSSYTKSLESSNDISLPQSNYSFSLRFSEEILCKALKTAYLSNFFTDMLVILSASYGSLYVSEGISVSTRVVMSYQLKIGHA